MNEERLQEIKDSIDLQRKTLIALNMQTLCVDEEMELYNEIIRLQQENQQLKKQKDDVVDYIKNHIQEYDVDGSPTNLDEFDFLASPKILLRMLGEIDVED